MVAGNVVPLIIFTLFKILTLILCANLTLFPFRAGVQHEPVLQERRDAGLGQRLLEAVVNHPQLANVRHFELYCSRAYLLTSL